MGRWSTSEHGMSGFDCQHDQLFLVVKKGSKVIDLSIVRGEGREPRRLMLLSRRESIMIELTKTYILLVI